MKIFVRVKANAKNQQVKKIDEINFFVSVKEAPIRGCANRAVVRVLAEYFKISESKIKLILGFSGRNKIFAINKL